MRFRLNVRYSWALELGIYSHEGDPRTESKNYHARDGLVHALSSCANNVANDKESLTSQDNVSSSEIITYLASKCKGDCTSLEEQIRSQSRRRIVSGEDVPVTTPTPSN